MDLFDYQTDFDIEKFLDQSQKHQRQLLESELEEVEDLLEAREALHRENLQELQSKKEWYKNRLKTLYRRGVGKQGNRDELKSRINEFYREIRGERRRHWLDRQKLEKERRELLRELNELEDDSLQEML